jgi:homoserine kinase
VTYPDASYNLARSALLVHALTSQPELLLEATADRLHQQARAGVYPQSVALVEQLRDLGHAAAISGAGPSVIVLSARPDVASAVAAVVAGDHAVAVRELPISAVGAHERPLDIS